MLFGSILTIFSLLSTSTINSRPTDTVKCTEVTDEQGGPIWLCENGAIIDPVDVPVLEIPAPVVDERPQQENAGGELHYTPPLPNAPAFEAMTTAKSDAYLDAAAHDNTNTKLIRAGKGRMLEQIVLAEMTV